MGSSWLGSPLQAVIAQLPYSHTQLAILETVRLGYGQYVKRKVLLDFTSLPTLKLVLFIDFYDLSTLNLAIDEVGRSTLSDIIQPVKSRAVYISQSKASNRY